MNSPIPVFRCCHLKQRTCFLKAAVLFPVLLSFTSSQKIEKLSEKNAPHMKRGATLGPTEPIGGKLGY